MLYDQTALFGAKVPKINVLVISSAVDPGSGAANRSGLKVSSRMRSTSKASGSLVK